MKKLGNVSAAVVEQRRSGRGKRQLDDFPTPPWATRAFIVHVLRPRLPSLSKLTLLEPCANRGYMARPASEYFGKVFTSDVKDYGWTGQQHTGDFLNPAELHPAVKRNGVGFILFNPPFKLAADFCLRALELRPRFGFAVLVRSAFAEGVDRFERLFSVHPPTLEAHSVERIPMVKGRYRPRASTASCYRWLVWLPGMPREASIWIPPSRTRFERDGDVKWERRRVR